MAHFAKVLDNKVQQVIVAEESFFDSFIDTTPGEWLKCSYNTLNNEHPENKPLRGNFPGIGFEYNRDLDIFIAPKPYNSWILDEEKAQYKAPVDYPDDGKDYRWNEDTVNWEEVPE